MKLWQGLPFDCRMKKTGNGRIAVVPEVQVYFAYE
jgi:hypothetical protein